MNFSPHAQSFAYRRNPAQTVHQSTFHPGQVGHGHNSAIYQNRPPQTHYSTSVSPFQPAQNVPVEVKEKEKETKPGGFNLASLAKYANIDELKGLVDRFGGLDGILSTVTTVQKVISTVGQIAPMVKVFTGVLGKNKNSQAEAEPIPARRRVRSTRPASRTKKSTSRKTSAASQSRRSVQARPTSARGVRRSTPLTMRQPSGRR